MASMEWPASDEVHVWSVELDRPAAHLARALSEDELLRAARYKVPDAGPRFVAARAALRTLLGRYLGHDPAALRFAAGPQGKPRLDHPPSSLQFNVSHSAGVALIAVAPEMEVGIDIEEIKPRQDLAGLARRVFTEREREAIALDEQSFYRHWVAKEAFVKATGRGISSVRSFEVLLDAPGGARLVHVGGDAEEAARWTLAPLDAPAGYAAAVVVRGAGATVKPTRAFEP
ncbi:MAG: 4-phosphopantetheinyl transferase [Thermoleophilaceae bacterium]|jgi:4'-phosphopantetheinyl transferase|nr:4-phosphopantetheinyl transferase [Thermoleophilaceae bacterium]